MRLSDAITHIPADRPSAILLRHAERSDITTIEDSYQAALTPAGREAARLLGVRLARLGPVRLEHSPVSRCRETAEFLAEGVRSAGGEANLAGGRASLGGPYMLDFRRAMARVLAEGAARFVRAWSEDSPELEDLVRPFHVSAREQLALLEAALRAAPPGGTGLWIGVSHDWNLLLVRETYLGLRHERDGWPDFLEGLLAYRDDLGRLVLRLGDRRVELAEQPT
jgi:broad specificity phosphatase PhoE